MTTWTRLPREDRILRNDGAGVHSPKGENWLAYVPLPGSIAVRQLRHGPRLATFATAEAAMASVDRLYPLKSPETAHG